MIYNVYHADLQTYMLWNTTHKSCSFISTENDVKKLGPILVNVGWCGDQF